MRRYGRWAALICIGFVVGCGGDSDGGTQTPSQVSREVTAHAERLAATMRRLNRALDGARCADVPRITELRDRVLAQGRRLDAYRTEPAFRDDIAGIRRTVRKIDAEIDLMIEECRRGAGVRRRYDAATLLNSAAPSIRPPSTTIELPVV